MSTNFSYNPQVYVLFFLKQADKMPVFLSPSGTTQRQRDRKRTWCCIWFLIAQRCMRRDSPYVLFCNSNHFQLGHVTSSDQSDLKNGHGRRAVSSNDSALFTHPCAQHFIPSKPQNTPLNSPSSYKIYLNFSAPRSTQLCPFHFILFSRCLILAISFLQFCPHPNPTFHSIMASLVPHQLCLLCSILFFCPLIWSAVTPRASCFPSLYANVLHQQQYNNYFFSNPYLSFTIQYSKLFHAFFPHPIPFLFKSEIKRNMLVLASEKNNKNQTNTKHNKPHQHIY